mgnify:CR=1 FL=1
MAKKEDKKKKKADEKKKKKWKYLEHHEKFRKLLPFIIVILLVGSWMFYSFNTEGIIYELFKLSPSDIQNFLGSMGFFAGAIFVILVILEVIIAPLIPLVLYVAGGLVFGPLLGGVLVLIGNLVGAYIVFKLVKKYGRSYVEKNVSKEKLRKFDRFSKKHGAFSLFLLRVNPVTSSDVFSYIYGLSNISLKKFLLATGLGIAPLIFVQSYLGGRLLENSTVLFPVLVVLTILFVAIIAYMLIKELLKKETFEKIEKGTEELSNEFYSNASNTLESGLNNQR